MEAIQADASRQAAPRDVSENGLRDVGDLLEALGFGCDTACGPADGRRRHRGGRDLLIMLGLFGQPVSNLKARSPANPPARGAG